MKLNSRVCVFLLYGAGLFFPLHGQTYGISGTVRYEDAKPFPGASVTLVNAKKTVTTDASGGYSFGGAYALPFSGNVLIVKTPALREKYLYFGVFEKSEPVRIDLFNILGRRVGSLVNQELSRGNYRISPFVPNMALQLFFIKVQTGRRTTIVKLPLTRKYAAAGGRSVQRLSGNQVPTSLAKVSAVVDTLVASAPEYQIVSKPIEAYSGVHDFVLTKTGFGLASPADKAMLCGSRKVTLSWNADPNATSYEVWLNVSRKDYDWMAPGSLLDRYTEIAAVAAPTLSCQTDSLPDRWTYKWYVVSVDQSGARHKSGVRTFGVYLPVLEQLDDGVALITAPGGYQVRDLNKNGSVDPYEDWHNPIDARVNNLMSLMSKEQKVLQMFYDAKTEPEAGWEFYTNVPETLMARQVMSAKTQFGIPHITAGDFISGYANVFPTQSGLAAARDLDLAYRCASVQRDDEIVCGLRGLLAPLAEVGTMVLYKRIQEGNGENAEFAAGMMRALHAGYNNGPEINPSSVLTNTKHWPGQGAGGEDRLVYDSVTIKYHMKPWIAAIEAGCCQIMPGYSKCPYLDPPGVNEEGVSKKTLDYLRNVLHYDGIICSDWRPSSYWVPMAFAGVDVMGGAPVSQKGEFTDMVDDTLVNQACRRVLTVKFKMGLFENPYIAPAGFVAINSPDKKAITDEAGKKIMTLLKNKGVLPLTLASGDKIVVAGENANDGSNHSCYVAWASFFRPDLGAKTILQSIQEKAAGVGATVYYDSLVAAHTTSDIKAAICVVGEKYYFNVHSTDWPVTQITLPDSQRNLVRAYMQAKIPTVVVYIMPRPYDISWDKDSADALLIAYRPGNGAGVGVSSVLFGSFTPKGRLPWQLPKSVAQVGTDVLTSAVEKWDLPYDLGATEEQRARIRDLIARDLPVNSISGDSLYGDPLYQYGAGMQGY
jgi:beta-glucosidase-like glycosyl hydrolase